MIKIYENQVQSIGSLAKEFLNEKMVILFGEQAPSGLKDYCYGIGVKPIDGAIRVGDCVLFNDKRYTITAIGNLVQKNLVDLGHITMKFDGSTVPELPGTLYLEEKELPVIDIGTTIEIGTLKSKGKNENIYV
ncbi:MAG: PTS glucitol/sorbitol transporter subunit IIA [Sporolactobacillus sp.]